MNHCEFCGGVLETLVFGRRRIPINKRFCNRRCAESARRAAVRTTEKPRHCLYCGAMLAVHHTAWQRAYRNKRYCNRVCIARATKAGKGKRFEDMPADKIERLIDLHYQRMQRERRLAS